MTESTRYTSIAQDMRMVMGSMSLGDALKTPFYVGGFRSSDANANVQSVIPSEVRGMQRSEGMLVFEHSNFRLRVFNPF